MATFGRIHHDTPLHQVLSSGETYTRDQLPAVLPEGYFESGSHLIAIKDDEGVDHFPKFQFTHDNDGKPTSVDLLVMMVNLMLEANRDPIKAAAWWTSPNYWIPKDLPRPMDHIGTWSTEEFMSFVQETVLGN